MIHSIVVVILILVGMGSLLAGIMAYANQRIKRAQILLLIPLLSSAGMFYYITEVWEKQNPEVYLNTFWAVGTVMSSVIIAITAGLLFSLLLRAVNNNCSSLNNGP